MIIDNVTTGSYHRKVKAVGVKILKAKLSEYLRLVKAGETVLITERDEVVAELRPAHRQNIPPSSLQDELERMADEGQVTLRASESKDWPSPDEFPKLEGVSSQDILNRLRGDSK